MGRKRMPGLVKRKGIWHIDKKIFGRRLCESTGASLLEEAEKYLARRVEGIRQASVYGVREKRLFVEAATKYLFENKHKRSIRDDAGRLKLLVDVLGDTPLDVVHIGCLDSYIALRRQQGVKTRTINHGLKIVRRILNLAASEWVDEYGMTWLASAPKIKMLPEPDLRKPYPLSWDEQDKLFNELPAHLRDMALFAVNTGCRDQEICNLRWEWERVVNDLPFIRIFLIPGEYVKNGDDRLVVCNDVAGRIIDAKRGQHATHVFSFRSRPLARMLSTGWRDARKNANLAHVRVHDLKHTYGRRLRSLGVSFEDRQDLLGHRSGRITSHYSAAEIENLYEASNLVCQPERKKSGVTLSMLNRVEHHIRAGEHTCGS